MSIEFPLEKTCAHIEHRIGRFVVQREGSKKKKDRSQKIKKPRKWPRFFFAIQLEGSRVKSSNERKSETREMYDSPRPNVHESQR